MRTPRLVLATPLVFALLAFLDACATTQATPSLPVPSKERELESLLVTATAYNSLPEQTDHGASVAAWGDTLKPGMKAIAVSRDLVDAGLRRGTRVQIEGLQGEYVVLDRMPARWDKRIDIYMGEDIRAARSWGVREVRIQWTPTATD